MVIGIDIRVLGNLVKSGVEEYAENLISQMIKIGRDIDFKLFYSSGRTPLPHYRWMEERNIKLYEFYYPNNFLFTSSRIFNRPFLDKMVGGADVFFFPHFFISSLSPKCRRVMTFHDLSYLHFPEYLTRKKKAWHNTQMIPKWQARLSDKIIAVSESTKNDLVNLYGIDPAKAQVIYSGISKNFLAQNLNDDSGLSDFKHSKNISGRFIFSLGKLEPRKNITSIIKAFSRLKRDARYEDLKLVIAGSRGWLCDDMFKEADISDFKNQIIFTGQLSDEEKVLYYRAADIFVYPSFFEGFGFPPLEAMYCGTPVITSRNSSLPEVVNEAAVVIDPYDTEELRLWITKLLDDKKFYSIMVKRGVEQASKFSWEVSATKTLELLVRP